MVIIDSTAPPKASIVKYHLNSAPVYISEDDAYAIDAQTEIIPINYNNAQARMLQMEGCVVVTLMCPWHGEHSAGSACGAANRGDLYWVYDFSGCGGGSGGGSIGGGSIGGGSPEGGSPAGDSPGGGRGGGGSGDDSNPNNNPGNVNYEDPICGGCTTTAPVVPGLNEGVALRYEIKNILELQSDSAEHNWLYNQATHDQLQSIQDFFEENGHSAENKNFVEEGIDAFLDGGDVDFDDRIIFTINKPCQKEIVKNLMSVSSPLTDLINETFGNTENVNVKFWNGNIQNPNANAYTNPFYSGNSNNYIIKIGFSDSFLDTGTNMAIVAVTLHELVHAYFISLYLDGELTATDSNYNNLLNAFVAFYENATQDTFDTTDNEIHNAMKDFINQIANGIYNYALQNNIYVTSNFCEKLAWGTMLNTDLIDEILTEDEKIDAQNVIITEQNNIEYDPSNPVKGTACE